MGCDVRVESDPSSDVPLCKAQVRFLDTAKLQVVATLVDRSIDDRVPIECAHDLSIRDEPSKDAQAARWVMRRTCLSMAVEDHNQQLLSDLGKGLHCCISSTEAAMVEPDQWALGHVHVPFCPEVPESSAMDLSDAMLPQGQMTSLHLVETI